MYGGTYDDKVGNEVIELKDSYIFTWNFYTFSKLNSCIGLLLYTECSKNDMAYA